MKLLGALGFDFKIFLIQAVNFLLLFLILKRLFFRPFIKVLRTEKNNILKWQNFEQKLNQEKEKWQKLKKEEKLKIVKQAENILAEAQRAAQTLKQNIYKQTNQEADQIIKKAKIQAKDLTQEQFNKINNNLRLQIKQEIQNFLTETFSPFKLKEINEAFFDKLLIELAQTNWPQIEKNNLTESLKVDKIILPKIKSKSVEARLAQTKNKKQKQNFLPLKLQYSHFFSKTQKEKLLRALKGKFGRKLNKLNLQTQQNAKLIIGYQLEAEGMILEVSLRKKLEKSQLKNSSA